MKKVYTILAIGLFAFAPNNFFNNTPQALTFSQTWTNTALITANDNWTLVPGIEGFLGQDITTGTGVDPQTLLTVSLLANDLDVIANQNNTTITNGGVAEFDGIADPTIALQGSGTADAPNIIMYLNTTALQNITVAYNVRDIDGSADNAIQQVALQYRVGNTGNFTNVPAGYIADATTAGTATQVTPINTVLPGACDNQAEVQVRIITSNAVGSDEWVGIDDINITGSPLSANSITTGAVTTPPFCVDASTTASGSVAFTSTGTFAGETFTAYLSDAAGSFASPVNIGTTTATGTDPSGNIAITIPAGTPTGVGYKIRIDEATLSITGSASTAFSIVNGATNATSVGSSFTPTTVTLNWTNPVACFDEVMIVAKPLTTIAGIPTGDGTGYTADLDFLGAGSTFDGTGKVVYKGGTTGQIVTNLTTNTQYFFRIFSRRGTNWSAGVEISVTPAVASAATDYFRSVTPGGNWGSTTTWESSPDNGVTPWIPATLVPDANANTITIRNTADVTVAAIAGGDQIVVDAGATLTLSAAFSLADGTGTDLDVNGTVVNTSGVHIFTGTTSFNAGTLYQHNRNGGTIIPATWALTSTCEVIGNTNSTTLSGGANQAFGNFTWNSPSQSVTLNLVGLLSTVNGNFRIQNVGTGTLRLTGTADLNLTVGGNYIVEGNNDIDNNVTGVTNISIGGNFTHTGGTFNSSVGVATITMTGAGRTFTQSGGTFTSTNLNWIINAGAGVTLLNNLPTSVGRSVLVTGTLDAAALQITGAGDVTVNGTLRTAHADGLELTGTLANSGTNILGAASTVDYYAAGAQIFSNRSDYANVIINGGGNKTLNGNATLSGILTLTNGYVVSTAANLITLTNTASTSGASNASFVNGPVSKIGNTAFTFPVGKPNCGPSGTVNGYAAIEISAPGSLTDQFTAEYKRGDALALGAIATAVDHISKCDYWTLNRDAGTSTVDITLYWDDPINNCTTSAPYINLLSSLTVVHSNNPGNWDAMGSVGGFGSTATGYVPWTGVQSATFGAFAIASTDFHNPLPITINYFTGTKQNSNHLLNWKVNNSNNSSVSMEIQRSSDGRVYTGIYTATATALQCLQPFAYTDNQVAKGVNYYRLKMTDATGKISYSNIVPLINADNGFEVMNIAPNPVVNRNFNLNISAAQKANVEIVITDMQGRLMQKRSVNMIAGFNTIPVNVSGFGAGTYQVYGVTAEGRSKVIRFVIQ